MCTVFIAWKFAAHAPLIVASNRDEFHQRPTSPAAWQNAAGDGATWFGGRDERDGGSWLGVAKNGRFAMITNFRKPAAENSKAQSRGNLVRRWLEGEAQAEFCQHLETSADAYNGFNLLFGDVQQLLYFGSTTDSAVVQTLAPGIYGLSNGALNEQWPKVKLGLRRFESAVEASPEIDIEVLTGLMADRRTAPDKLLPQTGVPLEWERMLSSLFIVSPAYGTRATTVFGIGANGTVNFKESRFSPSGDLAGETHRQFELEQ